MGRDSDAANQENPWKLEEGYDPWKGLVQADWTQREWRDWLEHLSPRMLVLHMQRWSLIAQAMPGLRDELYQGMGDARTQLVARECHL
jgi:hypothetical protein